MRNPSGRCLQETVLGISPDNALWVLRQSCCKVETTSFSLAQDGHILGHNLGMCPSLGSSFKRYPGTTLPLSSYFARAVGDAAEMTYEAVTGY